MTMKISLIILSAMMAGLCGCSTMYYGAMEKFGVHKRDILMDRVKDARDSQDEAKTQFLSAMDQFKSVVNFTGGDLEKEYNRLNDALQSSEARATAVRDRIKAVEDVSQALFKEWRGEIKQYSSDALRNASQRKYDQTVDKYDELLRAMKNAESKLEPVLVSMRDQVLFLKHNLNARAIAGLSSELASVQGNVDSLIRDMDTAIQQADQFIATLKDE
jgi:predicted  nucleic acid-binding Zn-ribbon protein